MNELEKIQRKKRFDLVMIFLLFWGSAFIMLHVSKIFQSDIKKINNPNQINTLINNVIKDIQLNTFFLPNKYELRILLLVFIGFTIWALLVITDDRKYMRGIEHGSSRWGTKGEKRTFRDRNNDNNIIITNDFLLSLNTKRTNRNLNVLIVGGAGTGKTRFFVKPNLMQLNTSYIVTDPKGDLFRETGKMFKSNGYKIKVFNLKDFNKSMHYNPFKYVKSDTDIMKLVNVIMKNTNGKKGENSNADPFWDRAESALLQAIFFYLYYEAPRNEQTLSTVWIMLQMIKVKEEDEDFVSDFDLVFKDFEEEKGRTIAVEMYDTFKAGAGKTAKSIVISAKSRLSFLAIPAISEIFDDDELDLDTLGDEKTILYAIIPDSNTTFNFIVAMMYTQLFDNLYLKADEYYKGPLKIPVRAILDEFANIGTIPNFPELLATMRSRSISCNIILQSMAQLEAVYKESWKGVVDNCDTFLFLGGRETSKYVSERLGKITINSRTASRSRGKSGSSTVNENILARDLMTADELSRMNDRNCIALIRGSYPFFSEKYNIKKHKNYNLLGSDGENSNNLYFEELIEDKNKSDNSEQSEKMSDYKEVLNEKEEIEREIEALEGKESNINGNDIFDDYELLDEKEIEFIEYE
ncbi:VirD4-like conjugal transfer protein, CD1115 family [Clostridium arbusti]|uniref:VirD4-like conjugal transfer protein, CD1115 family n=1 Tax=Clostridium arbusti TaxID=1137848 RepID=UPI00028A1594|nr:type IV secretory system conjugative DNA transfer family protein [Clostridium arbusti]